MAQLASPTCTPLDSVLACAHCARSKVKLKKLTCQTRVPQRGRPPSSANNDNPQAPPSTDTSENSDTVECDPVTSTTNDGGPKTTSPFYPTGNGIYIDWSHSIIHDWARNRPRSRSEAEQAEDSLARFVAATPRVDESYLPNLSLSSHPTQPGMFSAADEFDFVVPTQVLSTTTKLPDLTGMPSWNHALPLSPGTLARSTNDDGDYAMDDCVPPASLFPSLDGSLPNHDQLHTLEGWPLFHCIPIMPSSACVPTVASHQKSIADSHTVVESLLTSTREKLIAALQGLWLRGQDDEIRGFAELSIVVLPPPPVLDSLLRAYLTSYEPYYPFIPTVSLNGRLKGRNTILPSMQLFLMLAGGGMTGRAG
ncbi:hypothetical protein GB937_007874 [Aspergillus fischeri]|nr:hypothetical protein GB937_007874 [Aspergillus fischeri]